MSDTAFSVTAFERHGYSIARAVLDAPTVELLRRGVRAVLDGADRPVRSRSTLTREGGQQTTQVQQLYYGSGALRQFLCAGRVGPLAAHLSREQTACASSTIK